MTELESHTDDVRRWNSTLAYAERAALLLAKMTTKEELQADVASTVDADVTAYTDRSLLRQVDAGRVVLTVGTDASGAGLRCAGDVEGPARYVDHRRTMTMRTKVRYSGVVPR